MNSNPTRPVGVMKGKVETAQDSKERWNNGNGGTAPFLSILLGLKNPWTSRNKEA